MNYDYGRNGHTFSASATAIHPDPGILCAMRQAHCTGCDAQLLSLGCIHYLQWFLTPLN